MKKPQATNPRKNADPPKMLRSPVAGITGVWKFTRAPGGCHRASSIPGHLLHLLVAGAYRLRTNGREYDVKTRDVIYYHETEEVEWLGNRETVAFYSVGFMAPSLEPLPPKRRVFPSNARIRSAFEDLYAASLAAHDEKRSLKLHGALLRILAELDWPAKNTTVGEAFEPSLWWEAERRVRERRCFRMTLAELAAELHCSRATVVRACREAVGTSPMRRLRDLRMAEALGLLHYSTLNISQIAEYLGYERVHEFSREFRRCCGRPPTKERNL